MATDGSLTPAGHSAKAGLQPANSTPEYVAAPRRRQERALWQCHLPGADWRGGANNHPGQVRHRKSQSDRARDNPAAGLAVPWCQRVRSLSASSMAFFNLALGWNGLSRASRKRRDSSGERTTAASAASTVSASRSTACRTNTDSDIPRKAAALVMRFLSSMLRRRSRRAVVVAVMAAPQLYGNIPCNWGRSADGLLGGPTHPSSRAAPRRIHATTTPSTMATAANGSHSNE